jgi:leader peptidase (prepilin peptidase) / N-methyltransferase
MGIAFIFRKAMTIIHSLLYNSPLFLTAVTIIGCCVGSFLNVVIYRLPKMILYSHYQVALKIFKQPSVLLPTFNLWRPSSSCPLCGKAIPWFANISLISYLVLRAKTLCCEQKILFRYFLIEFLGGVLA